MKKLYEDIFNSGKQEELLRRLENADKFNNGKVSAMDLQKIILEITRSKYGVEDIQKFVR